MNRMLDKAKTRKVNTGKNRLWPVRRKKARKKSNEHFAYKPLLLLCYWLNKKIKISSAVSKDQH